MTNAINNGTRVPEAVSQYIVEYYVRHASCLLDNTNLRTPEANRERTSTIQKLIAELKFRFGYVTSEKKIKNHFDHVRSKVLQKGYAMNYATSRGKRFFPKGLGTSSAYSSSRRKEPFKNSVEEVIWKYYERRPICINERGIIARTYKGTNSHTEEGESSGVGEEAQDRSHSVHERMECKMEPDEQILSDSPSMEDIIVFDSDECVESRSEAVQTPPSPCTHTCQAGANLLKEMRVLCQEQRQFFHEMTHMMREVCSLVQLTRAQILEQAAVKSRSVRLKEIFQQDSAEAVPAPSLP